VLNITKITLHVIDFFGPYLQFCISGHSKFSDMGQELESMNDIEQSLSMFSLMKLCTARMEINSDACFFVLSIEPKTFWLMFLNSVSCDFLKYSDVGSWKHRCGSQSSVWQAVRTVMLFCDLFLWFIFVCDEHKCNSAICWFLWGLFSNEHVCFGLHTSGSCCLV
jgi:hypothetical protein